MSYNPSIPNVSEIRRRVIIVIQLIAQLYYIYMFGNNLAFFRSQARVNSGNSGLINDHSKVGSIPHHSIAYFDTIE